MSYHKLPQIVLTKEEKQFFSIIFHVSVYIKNMSESITLNLAHNISGNKSSVSVDNQIDLNVFQNKAGTKFFTKIKIGENKIKFVEIKQKNAMFIHKYVTARNWLNTCSKILKEIQKIEADINGEDGKFFEYKDKKLWEMKNKLSKICSKKDKIVRAQKFEDSANIRDQEKDLQKQIVEYILKTYPKKKLFQKPEFAEVFFGRDETVQTNLIRL